MAAVTLDCGLPVSTLSRSWLGVSSTLTAGCFVSTDLAFVEDETTEDDETGVAFLVNLGIVNPKDGTATCLL